MILRPDVLALLLFSLLASLMTLAAAGFGAVILRRWDIGSGSELQLALERRTYLVSTVVGYLLLFQLASLFLFIRTADDMSRLFVGAMCAAGSLSANPYGYPALLFKIAFSLVAALWLIVNRADAEGYDYPLIRPKYTLLLLLAPLVLCETVLSWRYFLGLRPDIITSCCGALFGTASGRIASEMAALAPVPVAVAFFACTILVVAAGIRFRWRGRSPYLLALASAAQFPLAICSIVSFLSPYVYELPSHHCPFCLLQKEYGYLGYPLYAALFSAVISGVGVGLLQGFRTRESLAETIPLMQRRLVLFSLASNCLLIILFSCQVYSSSLSLFR